jgi:hypothetical protein
MGEILVGVVAGLTGLIAVAFGVVLWSLWKMRDE